MKRNLFLILGFVLFTLISCEYKYVEPVVIELPDEPVSFSEQVEPFLVEKCAVCHSSRSPVIKTGTTFNSLTDGNYINITVPESSEIYEKTNGGHPGGNSNLSAKELALLLKWITDGAENN